MTEFSREFGQKGAPFPKDRADLCGVAPWLLACRSPPLPRLVGALKGVTSSATSGATYLGNNRLDTQAVKCQVRWVSPVVITQALGIVL